MEVLADKVLPDLRLRFLLPRLPDILLAGRHYGMFVDIFSEEGSIMADVVRRIEYYYTAVPDRPGAGAKILNALKEARVNLVAYNGFPIAGGRAQLDFVPSNRGAFLRAARRAGIKLVGPKTALLFQGEDRVGIVADILSKLGQARINVTAINGISSGRRRFGAILWVKPRNLRRAAEALGAS